MRKDKSMFGRNYFVNYMEFEKINEKEKILVKLSQVNYMKLMNIEIGNF